MKFKRFIVILNAELQSTQEILEKDTQRENLFVKLVIKKGS